jgi:trimethylamine--corrinoid protein Co-methyltransferase
MLRGFMRNFRPLEILTEEQVEAIHRGTLDVLQQTGVRLEHKGALEILSKHGCKVDFEGMRVRFPPGLVEECLRRCPSSFRVKARDPRYDLILGGNTVYFGSAPGMETVDLETWEPRPPTRRDYHDAVRVLDALPNHHYHASYTPYFGFKGVPEVMKITEGFAAKVRCSPKVSRENWARGCEVFNIMIAQAVGTEVIIPGLMASPPLTFYEEAVEPVFRVLEAGMPVAVDTGTIFGATGPTTLAGSLLTYNAELIAQIVLIQVIKPGARTFVFGFPNPLNMRNGSPAFGSISTSLFLVACNQIWRRYGVPLRNTASCYTSSKMIDFQNGYEKATAAVLSAVSGAHNVCIHGGMYGELAHHPVQAILDDDIAGMVGRFVEGIQVTHETLAIDLINEVGPVPGVFLDKAHTREWWRKEHFVPKVADGLTYPEWIQQGKKGALDLAREKLAEILATHKPMPLTSSQEQAVEDVLKEAREYYRKKGLISDEEWRAYQEDLASPNYPYA